MIEVTNDTNCRIPYKGLGTWDIIRRGNYGYVVVNTPGPKANFFYLFVRGGVDVDYLNKSEKHSLIPAYRKSLVNGVSDVRTEEIKKIIEIGPGKELTIEVTDQSFNPPRLVVARIVNTTYPSLLHTEDWTAFDLMYRKLIGQRIVS